jgi:3-deoxy-D-manno-octulosonate 8-phosphate phosphatase (KDO 8-P phosphatase)
MTLSAQDRARRVKIILFDVDGVLTDGGIWLFPAPAASSQATLEQIAELEGKGGYAISSTSMVEAKGYNAHDGTAISLARLGGMKLGIITKRISETVALRARDLRLEFVYQGHAFKMKAVREIMEKEGVTLEEIAYVGDDVIDLPVMRECGFAVAVANARAGEGRSSLCDAEQGRARRGARCGRVHPGGKRRAQRLHRGLHRRTQPDLVFDGYRQGR